MTRERQLPITAAWIAQVRAHLDASGPGSQKALAVKVKCSSPAIGYILGGTQQNSYLVGPISDALNIPRPQLEPLDKAETDLLDRYRSISKQDRAVIDATLAALVAAKSAPGE